MVKLDEFKTVERPISLVLTFTLIILIRSSSGEDHETLDSEESMSELQVTHHGDPSTNITALIRELIVPSHNQSSVDSSVVKSSVNLPKPRQIRRKQITHEPIQSQDTDDGLAFDSSYFATLNAVNHRPHLSPSSISFSAASPPANHQEKDSNNSRNLFYYSPESYGKLSHKNHQNTAFTFSYNGLPVVTSPPSTASPSDGSNSNAGASASGEPENSKQAKLPSKVLISDKPKPKMSDQRKDNGSTSSGSKKKDKISSVYLPDDKPSSVAVTETPYDDSFAYEIGEGNNGDKYYYQDPFLTSTTRSKGLNLKQSKPLRYPDVAAGSGPGAAPMSDYIDEDYDSSDSYAEYKNLPPMLKAAMSSPKYSGGPPYRYPMYSSYYPTRFYAPYDGENSPGKSSPGGVNSWSGLAGFLLGILPLGILMASMVPAFVSVPVATATAGVGRKKRSLDSPLQKARRAVAEYQEKLRNSEGCIKRMLCSTLKRGKSDEFGMKVLKALDSM